MLKASASGRSSRGKALPLSSHLGTMPCNRLDIAGVGYDSVDCLEDSSNLIAGFYPFISLFLWSRMRGFACDGNRRKAADCGRIGANRTDLGKATPLPFRSTELRGKETFYAVPGNRNPCRQTAEAKDVHIVILHALSRRKIIVTDCRAHPFNLIGSNGRPYATATEQHTAFDDARCDGAGKGNGKVWIIVVPVVGHIAEVDNLVANCAEQDVDLLFHLVSAMIGGDADFHLFT